MRRTPASRAAATSRSVPAASTSMNVWPRREFSMGEFGKGRAMTRAATPASAGAVGDHPLRGRPQEVVVESVAETAERQLVDDLVVDARAGLDRAERVAMLPAPEWSAELHVGEAGGRVAA